MTKLEAGRLDGLIPRFRSVLTRRSSLALGVRGDPGVGKSFEVQQLLRAVGCQRFLMKANAPILEWLDGFPRPVKLPFWALRALERLEQGANFDSGAVCAALTSLLVGLPPVVWVLEDAHEAEPDRLELLHELGRAVLRTKGVALIVTSRVQLAQPFEGHVLEALSKDDSNIMLEKALGAKMPSEASDWIESRACGNPLFALEYLRYLARAGFLWNDGNVWHWRKPLDQTMPVTIEALIERLLDQSSQNHNSPTLEAAAVLLPGTAEAVWAEVAGIQIEQLREQQAELERHGLFRNGWFAHPLFREVAANGLTVQRRHELARRAVTTFERHDPQTAAQYLNEAQLEDGVALSLLERAALDASSCGNAVQAARWLAQAVDHARGETQIHLALKAAQALREVDLPAAQGLVERVVGIQPNERAAVYLLSELLAQQGQANQAIKLLERIATSQTDSSQHLGQQLRVLALAQDFERVIALYHQHRTSLGAINSELASKLAWSFFFQGQTDQAQSIISQALEQPRLSDLDKADLSNVLAMLENAQGNQTRAETLLSDAIKIYQTAGHHSALAETLYNRARTLHNAGRYLEAMSDLERAAQLESERGDGHAQAITQIFMAELQTEFGEYQKAEELLNNAKTVLEHYGDSVFLVSCQATLSLLYRAWESPYGGVLALKHAHSALKIAGQHGQMLLLQALRAAASAEAWSGQSTRALEYAHQSLEIANALAQPKALIWARATLALALESNGKLQQAQIEYQTAIGLAEQVKLSLEANRYGLEVDRLTHNTARAKQRLDWFQGHGLQHCANLSQKYFPELRVYQNQNEITFVSPVCPQLELLGSMQLRQGNTVKTIRGQKRKELLVVLLEARISGKPEIPQFELCENIYPAAAPEEAAVALKQLVFQIRSSFGQGAISTTSNGYALGGFVSDAEKFLQSGDTQLWRGVYTEGFALEARDQTVSDALYLSLRLGVERLIPSETKEATRLGKILLEAEPYDLEVLKLCLNALRADGNHRSLSRVYDTARTRMLEVGEILPEYWQTFLKPVSA